MLSLSSLVVGRLLFFRCWWVAPRDPQLSWGPLSHAVSWGILCSCPLPLRLLQLMLHLCYLHKQLCARLQMRTTGFSPQPNAHLGKAKFHNMKIRGYVRELQGNRLGACKAESQETGSGKLMELVKKGVTKLDNQRTFVEH